MHEAAKKSKIEIDWSTTCPSAVDPAVLAKWKKQFYDDADNQEALVEIIVTNFFKWKKSER